MRCDSEVPADRPAQAETCPAATARLALALAVPGLALTAWAAAASNALALRADLALSLLDAGVLCAVWLASRAGGADRRGARRRRRAETIAVLVAALGMTVSMLVVAFFAIQRLLAGGVPPQGDGIALGMGVNLAYAVVNGLILLRWRRRMRTAPSALARSQICLFSDKLASNLLLGASLALALLLQPWPVARYVDPVAGLLIATATACWTAPVLRDAILSLTSRGRRRPAAVR